MGVIGIFYTDKQEAIDHVEAHKKIHGEVRVDTRLGFPYRVYIKDVFNFGDEEIISEATYSYHKINNDGEAHQDLCGVQFSGVYFLGLSTQRVDIVNYIMSRIRG